ncbi:MAG TPA: efflux RND transporter periplasmic adaptor subunit [Polyangia bacterium]|jgi:cobalt-zinc-cadmium efflux system membrane fusion protein
MTKPPTETTPSKSQPTAELAPRRRRGIAVLLTAGAASVALALFLLARAGASRGPEPIPTPPVAEARTATVALRAGATGKNAIEVVPVTRTRLAGDIHMIGSVSFSADHVAIVGPLVSGRVTRLNAGIGTHVERGQVIAEIESVDVGEARAALLSATARLSAAQANLHRERELADKQISSAREREVAEAQWAGEGAAMRAAQQRLRAIGLSPSEIEAVGARDDGGRVPLRAPIAGTVIERFVTLGQAVERATDAFKIADLAQVWVLLDLYEKDLAHVHVGQNVELRTDTLPGELFQGRVAYVVPVIDEATRAAKVRIEIANPSGKLRIGQLVTAKLIGNAGRDTEPVLAIPVAAVQRIEGKPAVFVKSGSGFQRRTIELGVAGGDLVEVRSGLREDDAVAAKGAFLLKSELLR